MCRRDDPYGIDTDVQPKVFAARRRTWSGFALGRRSDGYQLIVPESVAGWVASKFDN
jgi:hypothetical protein